ncbi:EAL domain-containing protein [Spirochaeta dissipatitropha]
MAQEETQSIASIQKKLLELSRENTGLRRMLNTNPYTGLPIRRVCERRLLELHSNAQTKGSYLLLIRLDNEYERIKDLRDQSKALLVKTILRIRKLCGDQLYQSDRLDEFFCILPAERIEDSENESGIYTFMEQLNASISREHEAPASDVHFGAFIAAVPVSGFSADDAVRVVFDLLLEAIRNQQRTLVYNPGLADLIHRRRGLERSIADQTSKGFPDFFQRFQPIVDNDHRICGVEALLRWKHPEFGLIPPDEFLSIAEESGGVKHIAQWSLYQALHASESWTVGDRKPYVSVNVSALQFFRTEIVERILEILKSLNVPPGRLQLELSDAAFHGNIKVIQSGLDRLHKAGVRCVIDDFGGSYSALRHLPQLPLSAVKFSRSLLEGASGNPVQASIIKAVIQVCRDAGILTHAGGIESAAEAAFFIDIGCDCLQGYYYSAPVEAGVINDFVSAGGILPA